MSYNLVNPTTGDLTRVAGRGKAEYGASTVREGTFNNPLLTGNNHGQVNITFSTPMPDSNYMVDIAVTNSTYIYNVGYYIKDKTVNGFTIVLLRDVEGAVSANSITYSYTAFKLYTDTEVSQALANTEYSTTEQRVGTWIDNKPLYRKVLSGPYTLALAGASWNNTNIDMTGVDTLINFTFISNGCAMNGFYTRITSNKLEVYVTANVITGMTGPIVLEYTKTTD